MGSALCACCGSYSASEQVLALVNRAREISAGEQDIHTTNDLLGIAAEIEKLQGTPKMDWLKGKANEFVQGQVQREELIDPYLKWCHHKGVKIHPDVDLRACGSDWGLGLFAKKKLEVGEEVVVVSKTAMMCSDGFDETTAAKDLYADSAADSWQQVRLALWLMRELRNPKSDWAAYMRLLPELPHPVMFDERAVECLSGSDTQAATSCLLGEVIECFCTVYLASKNVRLFESMDITPATLRLRAFRTAMSIVLSRSLRVDGDAMTAIVIVPFWDMLNHGPANVHTTFDTEKGVLRATTCKVVRAGQQLFINYKDATTEEFYTVWGLSCPNRDMPLRMELPNTDPLFTKKTEILTRLGLPTEHTLRLQAYEPRPLGERDLCYMLVYCADATDCQALSSNAKIPQRLWVACWKLLERKLTERLQRYNKTMESNQALLRICHSDVCALALQQVIMEQRLLEDIKVACARLQNTEEFINRPVLTTAAVE